MFFYGYLSAKNIRYINTQYHSTYEKPYDYKDFKKNQGMESMDAKIEL